MATVPSTNDHLKRLAHEGAAEWTVVLADEQTAGRGRHGRTWVSAPGGLYMSVLLRPLLAPDALSLLPLAAGVAVAEALAEGGVEARLKWPNDVLIGERKVGGVLAEASSASRGTDWVVLGVGINVEAPKDVAETSSATSLGEAGCAIERWAVAAAVLERLSVCYDALARPQEVLNRWRELSVTWWGRTVEVQSAGVRVAGVARGVDSRGALLLELADGSVTPVVSGEARELRLR